jgi:polar amino acid transport system permease protein
VGNELIALLKDSSLVSIRGMVELMKITQGVASRESSAFIYLPAGALYLIMTTVFTVVFEKLEKKYSVYE